MHKAVELLRAATESFPPDPGQHHALTLKDGGPGLTLALMLGEIYQTVFLDSEDLLREVPDIIADIRSLLSQSGA